MASANMHPCMQERTKEREDEICVWTVVDVPRRAWR
uniref:Uncharacterized protein n=1 Tax=Arundo donax TaxID=35708 RepID=A0A0A9F649_ARUDO